MTVTWSETRPAGDADKAWRAIAMTPDGSKMLAGVYGGRLYLYSGGSWAETQPAGNADKNWQTTAMSPDGSKMLAGTYNGRLYLGEDDSGGGSSGTVRWTELTGGMQMLSGGMRG